MKAGHGVTAGDRSERGGDMLMCLVRCRQAEAGRRWLGLAGAHMIQNIGTSEGEM